MLDFLTISCQPSKSGRLEIRPDFSVEKHKDIMIRGGKFYAIWIADKGLWSTSIFDAIRLIDNEMDRFYEDNKDHFGNSASILYLRKSSNGSIDRFNKFCSTQMPADDYIQLDQKITFQGQETTREDYASKRLPYQLVNCPTPAWDKLVSTLYNPEERAKIEWAIGAVMSGNSEKIQKFFVLYGSGGTGKSTILNIIEKLFEGYSVNFSAANLGNSSKDFAFEPFQSYPLVALDQEGKLNNIDDNTRLNALVSHDKVLINAKYMSTYTSSFKCVLFIATNSPVKITDAKSGLIRRLIDIEPSGRLLDVEEYNKCVEQVNYELGGIAMKCRDRYISDPRFYDGYTPRRMIVATNDFFNFITDLYLQFGEKDKVPLNMAYTLYKQYCEDSNIPRPYTKTRFREEMEQYFYHCDMHDLEDPGIGVTYRGFRKNKLNCAFTKEMIMEEQPKEVKDLWLTFLDQKSIFDQTFPDAPAQYEVETEDGRTRLQYKWANCKTTLKEIDTTKVHYVQVPLNHIVVDFDIPDENGKKNFELNREAALKFPPTYAELSKSGEGIHLHYYYVGDPTELIRRYSEHVEIKVFTGNSSLRRRFTKCNNVPILTITGGLPVKKKEKVEKVIKQDVILSERKLRETIDNVIHKAYPNIGGTKVGMEFIKKILDEQYENGAHYSLTDMKPRVLSYAFGSTHHAEYCVSLMDKIKWESEDASEPVIEYEDKSIVFYDIEIFPNLLLVCWKVEGLGKPVQKMFNPSAKEIKKLFDMKLIGFNNRNYDNHIVYARGQDYTNEMMYNLSQKIISGDDRNAKFREAYNLSFTDIYDFASAGNKKSLKKLEIEMAHISREELAKRGFSKEKIDLIKAGGHHQELGLPWDQPVPEELWDKVAEYCINDVIATEAAFNYLYADFSAREALAAISNSDVNQTTNTLSQAFIFEDEKNPQTEFCYRNMSKPVKSLPSKVQEFLEMACPDMMAWDHRPHDEEPSLLPYFPGYTFDRGKSTYMGCEAGEGGYVYSEPGLHMNVALLDVASMHPHSTIAECLFGPTYTARFRDIVEARVCIKHKDWEGASKLLDGKLIPFIEKIKAGEMKAKDLANALKTVINSVYGLTAASFSNRFRDERNKDNIVAKRGALFMIELQHEVQKAGYKVAHIKTDSIKIPDATPDIIDFVMRFGKRYGYTFEHEATYERMVLVNKAVYIAKFATADQCQDLYGYVPDENRDEGGEWTATGDEFKIPYVFKRMFSHEDISFKDVCRTFQVKKGDLNLDFNEDLPDCTEAEKAIKKLEQKYKKGELSDITFEQECEQYRPEIEAGHNYHYIGRVGEFVPVKDGCGGGVLYRMENGKPYAASGSTGYRWKEAEIASEDEINYEFWESMVADSIDHISEYCDYEWFVS